MIIKYINRFDQSTLHKSSFNLLLQMSGSNSNAAHSEQSHSERTFVMLPHLQLWLCRFYATNVRVSWNVFCLHTKIKMDLSSIVSVPWKNLYSRTSNRYHPKVDRGYCICKSFKISRIRFLSNTWWDAGQNTFVQNFGVSVTVPQENFQNFHSSHFHTDFDKFYKLLPTLLIFWLDISQIFHVTTSI